MPSATYSTTATQWYSIRQLNIFQLIFGLYLTQHFIQLIPHVEELFSREGMIADPHWMPTYGYFPNVLYLIDYSPKLLGIFLVILTCFSLMFALRVFVPRLIALFLWYGWACLLNRNILILNPGIPYIGLLLLAFSLISVTTREKNDENDEEQELSQQTFPWIYWGGWTLYALGYTISGLHKLQSPSWIDGSALSHVLKSPLSRNNYLCQILLQSNPIFLQLFTWGSLFAEISFFPLGLFYHTRRVYWCIFLGFHIGVLLLINFADLTFGILVMHFFLFDTRWLL